MGDVFLDANLELMCFKLVCGFSSQALVNQHHSISKKHEKHEVTKDNTLWQSKMAGKSTNKMGTLMGKSSMVG